MSSLLCDFFTYFVFTSKDSGAPASNKETSIVELLITKIVKFAIGKKYQALLKRESVKLKVRKKQTILICARQQRYTHPQIFTGEGTIEYIGCDSTGHRGQRLE